VQDYVKVRPVRHAGSLIHALKLHSFLHPPATPRSKRMAGGYPTHFPKCHRTLRLTRAFPRLPPAMPLLCPFKDELNSISSILFRLSTANQQGVPIGTPCCPPGARSELLRKGS